MIQEPTRKELFDMTTQQLYDLNGKVARLEERIKAELIGRGNY